MYVPRDVLSEEPYHPLPSFHAVGFASMRNKVGDPGLRNPLSFFFQEELDHADTI